MNHEKTGSTLRRLAIHYNGTPSLFYRGERSRLQNSQQIPLSKNSSWGDGAMIGLCNEPMTSLQLFVSS